MSYPVGRSVFHGQLALVGGGLCLVGVILAYVYRVDGWSYLIGAAALWGGAVFGSWKCTRIGFLYWTANRSQDLEVREALSHGSWEWSDGLETERETLRIVKRIYDWQSAMLIQATAGRGHTRWVWLERRSDPLRWDDLRRALRAHA